MPPLNAARIGNADCPWDEFDSNSYVDHNYRIPRDDDKLIIDYVRQHFSATLTVDSVRGVDVGTGPNLYPALAMLPFCTEIELREHSNANVAWLRNEIRSYSPSWDEFWKQLAQTHPYDLISDPRDAVRQKVRVRQRDLFQPGSRQFGVGTMFFVAESITAKWDEFTRAVHQFIGLLRPGAPFAAAFMKGSTGYQVGDHHFPAVAIAEHHIEEPLSELGCDVAPYPPIPMVSPIREGYDGMILALGRSPVPEMHDKQ